jgi:MFS family permease
MSDIPPMNDPDIQVEASDAGSDAADSSYAVLRNRDLRLYLFGRFVGVVGQQMFAMAVGWELYERTGSAFNLGLVGLTQVLPMFLLTLPAGHFADNYNRKRIIVLTTLLVAGASAALTFLSAAAAPIRWIYVCLFVTGAARTFLMAATSSFLPQLVDRKVFSRAVTWNSGMFQLSSILGPAAGGALIGIRHHAAPVYAFNALAALIFCLFISLIRKHHVVAVRQKLSFKTLLTGFSFVFASRIILGIITLDMFAVLLGGATALLPIYAKDILFVGPRGLGLLQAALPLGAVTCTFILAHRRPIQKAGRSLLWAVTVFGLATVAFGFSRWFWFSFAMLFTCGAVDNISVVVRQTLVQLLTPDDKRGRVSAVNNLFIGTSNELGEFESGTVAQWFGPSIGNSVVAGTIISAVAGGVGTVLVVIAVALIWPEIRKYGRLDA